MTLEDLYLAAKPVYVTGRQLRLAFRDHESVLLQLTRAEELGRFTDDDGIEVTSSPESSTMKWLEFRIIPRT
jgi:hypothetical protein